MLISLAMSASLPRAFEDLGLWVGGAYAVQQVGRTVFMVIALRGHARGAALVTAVAVNDRLPWLPRPADGSASVLGPVAGEDLAGRGQ